VANVESKPAGLESGDADAASPPAAEGRRVLANLGVDPVCAGDRRVGRERELGAAAEADVTRVARFDLDDRTRDPEHRGRRPRSLLDCSVVGPNRRIGFGCDGDLWFAEGDPETAVEAFAREREVTEPEVQASAGRDSHTYHRRRLRPSGERRFRSVSLPHIQVTGTEVENATGRKRGKRVKRRRPKST
jgi:hypothetical protein